MHNIYCTVQTRDGMQKTTGGKYILLTGFKENYMMQIIYGVREQLLMNFAFQNTG
jgi:hypothetical protein